MIKNYGYGYLKINIKLWFHKKNCFRHQFKSWWPDFLHYMLEFFVKSSEELSPKSISTLKKQVDWKIWNFEEREVCFFVDKVDIEYNYWNLEWFFFFGLKKYNALSYFKMNIFDSWNQAIAKKLFSKQLENCVVTGFFLQVLVDSAKKVSLIFFKHLRSK